MKRNRFLPKRVSSAVIFSIFGSGSCEEVHYCGKWFLRQWRYGIFSEEVWSSSGRKKQVDFSQRLGKTSRFFFVIFKSRSAFSNGKEKHHYEFFFQMCWSCSPSSLIRHSQSSRWFFSVVLLEDVIVEDWGGFTNSSFFLRRTRDPLLWPNFNHWGRENAGAEAAFFFLPAGML